MKNFIKMYIVLLLTCLAMITLFTMAIIFGNQENKRKKDAIKDMSSYFSLTKMTVIEKRNVVFIVKKDNKYSAWKWQYGVKNPVKISGDYKMLEFSDDYFGRREDESAAHNTVIKTNNPNEYLIFFSTDGL